METVKIARIADKIKDVFGKAIRSRPAYTLGGAALGGGLYGASGNIAARTGWNYNKADILKNDRGYDALKRKADRELYHAEKTMGKNSPEYQKLRDSFKQRLSNKEDAVRKDYIRTNTILSALGGATIGGAIGYTPHLRSFSGSHSHSNRGGGFKSGPTISDIDAAKKFMNVEGVKTKAEAKKIFRAAARKAHPDMGGSDEAMKEANKHWDNLQNSDWFKKLATTIEDGFFKRAGI